MIFMFLQKRQPPRCTRVRSSAASDVDKGQPPKVTLKNDLHEYDEVDVYENSEDETEEREYLKTLEDNLHEAHNVNKNLNRGVVDSYFEGRYCEI